MKKILFCLFAVFATLTAVNAQDYNGYYMGPGMMYDGGDYCYGPGMMGGYWMDNGWHRYGNQNLNLTQDQQSQWNNTYTQGKASQQAINDSINYYVAQIKRLERAKSPLVQDDLNQIKQILTPDQYTQFLEKLVTGNPGN